MTILVSIGILYNMTGYFCAPEGPLPSCYLPGRSMKSSPYIGIFRHAPPEWQQHWSHVEMSMMKKAINKSHNRNQEMTAVQPNLSSSNDCHSMHVIHVDGRLLGGVDKFNDNDSSEKNQCSFSSWTSSSATTWLERQVRMNAYPFRSLTNICQLFERLNTNEILSYVCIPNLMYDFESLDSLQKSGTDLLTLTGAVAIGGIGILFPKMLRLLPRYYDEKNSECDNPHSHCDTDCDRQCKHESENRCSMSTTSIDETATSSSSLTSQDATNIDSENISNHPSLDVLYAYEDQVSVLREARLDYIITQVDITRMAKKASRHLKVKSILALPTITYQSNLQKKKDNEIEIQYIIPPECVSDDEREYISKKEGAGLTCTNDVEIVGNNNSNMISSGAIAGGWSWQMVVPDKNGDETEVKDIPEHLISKSNETQACVICLENFQDGDTLRVLPCGHLFHVGCIDHWLLGTYSDDECVTSGCPTCKKEVSEINDDGNEDSIEDHIRLDGSVPSWAFQHVGDALDQKSYM